MTMEFGATTFKLSSLVFLLCLLFQSSNASQQKPRPVTSTETSEVVQAIRDEIYTSKKWDGFWGFEKAGPRGPEVAFQIYVTPDLVPATGGMSGQVIYKYPPFGEVLRHFVVAPNGLAYLGGDPVHGFPWTQSDVQTIYLNDDDICHDKHDWTKVVFEMDLSPTQSEISGSKKRQRQRIGSDE